MWSRKHECCQVCGTTVRKHMARGMCGPCYQSTYYQDPQTKARLVKYRRAWYYRHHEHNLQQRAVNRDLRHFDGKRTTVLKRDSFTCIDCGATEKLVVHHNDKSGRGCSTHNNVDSNLGTLCRACHIKHHRADLLQAREAKHSTPKLLKCGRWSLEHDVCVHCGNVTSRHASKGLCTKCYQTNKMT